MLYSAADQLFLGQERRNTQLNRALTKIPPLAGRKGGTHSLTDWAYTIGVFHTVLHYTLGDRENIDLLDVGCGTGRLALASQILLGRDGSYTGVDINRDDVGYCQRYYDDPRFKFVHLEHKNRAYAAQQQAAFTPYPFPDNAFDAVTALSVWTHLNEADATFYMAEIGRTLRPGGKAVITFFLLDAEYESFLASNPPETSAFTLRNPQRYRFDQPVDASDAWFSPAWAGIPESAIGVTPAGLARLEQASGLTVAQIKHGYWHERPGAFFQDIVIFEKKAR